MSRKLLFVLAAVVLFTGGFGTALVARPARIEYKDKIVERQVEAKTFNQNVNLDELVKKLQTMMEKRNVSTKKTTVEKADGEKVTTEETHDLTETSSTTETDTHTLTSIQSELKLLRETLHLEEHTKLVIAPQPNYRLTVGVGYDFGRLWGRGAGFNLIPTPGLVAQLQLERRLFGSFFAGLWVQSTAVAGVNGSATW